MKENENIILLEKTGSTNDDVFRLMAEGARDFTVVCAKEQTSGRGRLGRIWESEPGGLYMSTGLKEGLTDSNISLFPLAAGLALYEGILEILPELSRNSELRLKWPNDLLYGKKKLAGILAESLISHEKIEFLVIGLGVNVNQKFFSISKFAEESSILENVNASHLATNGEVSHFQRAAVYKGHSLEPVSLSMITGKNFELDKIFYTLLSKLRYRLDSLRKNGPESFKREYEKAARIPDTEISIPISSLPSEIRRDINKFQRAPEAAMLKGIALGITDRGALRVKTGSIIHDLTDADGVYFHSLTSDRNKEHGTF